MLSISESEDDNSFDLLMEKLRKEKNEKSIEKINSYIEVIKALSNEIKNKENILLFYNLKLNKIKDEYDEINNEIIEEENDLIEKYMSSVEQEEFFLSPSNLEIKDISERARKKKINYDKTKEDYNYEKIYINKEEEELDECINNLPDDEHDIFIILKELLLNDKDMNKIKDDLDLFTQNRNKNYNDIIRKNNNLIREIKDKLKSKRNEIKEIRKEIKNNYDKKARKNMNHLNYTENISIVKSSNIKKNINNTYDINIENSILNNNSNNSLFLYNDDLNKTNISMQNNISTNLNKTFYLRANKSLSMNGITGNKKIKSYTQFLKTDTTERFSADNKTKKKNVYICKRLLKNYCNKYADKNKEFIFDIKMKEKNKSMPKNLYKQRKMIREELSNYIYINGNKYKQSIIGKATDTINGVY